VRPPLLAIRLIVWRLGADAAEFVLGDLAEGFAARGREQGAWRARAWYWRQALGVLMPDRSVLPRQPAPGPGVAMASLIRNLKLAGRTALRQPLFTATVTLTLALAIGANAVIFGMVDMLLLRPLPIAEPDRVGWVFGVDQSRGADRGGLPPADYLDLRAIRAFSHVAAIARAGYTLTSRGDARRLEAYQITPNLFDVWGLAVVRGRRFVPADGEPGAAPVALLAHQFWLHEYGGDPGVVGQPIALSGTPHEVIGVLGPDLNFGNLAAIHVWTPLVIGRAGASRADPRLSVMGLLAPGATLEQADAEVKAIAARIREEHPATHTAWSARVVSTREGMTGADTWLILTLLAVTVVMVLLIACANVTNILLAGLAARGRELAVRAALGASRRQIVAQLLAEALVLAAAGGLLGLAFSHGAIKALGALAEGNFVFDTLAVDYRMVLFAMTLAFIAPAMFALIPAMQSTRRQASTGLNALGTRIAGTGRARRLRGTLVVAQIALAMALMVVSTLALRTAIALMEVDLGVASDRIATVRFEVPVWKYASDDEVRRMVEGAVDRLRAVPGVATAAAASAVPAIDADILRPLDVEGQPLERGQSRLAGLTVAGSGYFETLGISIVAGRAFDGRDGHDGRRVAIVSRTAADRHLGGVTAALGRRVRLDASAALATVVGVAADIVNPDVDQDPNPIVYLPFAQQPQRDAVVLAASDAPAVVTGGMRDAMRALDPDVAVAVETFDAMLGREFAATRALVALFAAFGGVALALAASGLYGVIAFVVAQRTREIGVRVALGARPADVRRLMLGQGGSLIAAGLGIGLAGSLALAQVTRGILFGVRASDPSTYLAVALLVGITAMVAVYVPARRAMRIDPMQALTAE
jgi:predicted permease